MLKYLLQKKLMSFFSLSLLLSIKCLHPCPVFLNLNSREPTPIQFKLQSQSSLVVVAGNYCRESLSAPFWLGRKLLSHNDPFRMVLINNNITPKALRFSWLLAGKWGQVVPSGTSFRTFFSRISNTAPSCIDLIYSPVTELLSLVSTFEPQNPLMRIYTSALWHRTSVFKCFTQVNMNWALTAFIILTVYHFKPVLVLEWMLESSHVSACWPHCPDSPRSFAKDNSAVDFTVANFNSKLITPSLVTMKNRAFQIYLKLKISTIGISCFLSKCFYCLISSLR